MEGSCQLCPNELEVAAKVIDGEAIIIRLSDGTYFSLNSAGSLVWELIEQRKTIEAIRATLLARYDVREEEVGRDVTRLADELLREHLVTTTNDAGSVTARELPAAEGRQPYEAPQLQKYQDMADLLALDPPAPGLAHVVWKDPASNE
jgi:Coenzyme PQQ synthesis protein D (PqqD)